MAALEAERQAQAKEAEERDRMAQLQGLARDMFPDNPRAQLLFTLDPKAFGGVLAEGLGRQTYKPGEVTFDPMSGETIALPDSEQFGDRYAVKDPMTGEVRYTDARPPTYAEETGRMNADTSRMTGMGNLGVARARLGLERERFERGPASGGGSSGGGAGGLSGMTNEQLLEMLRR